MTGFYITLGCIGSLLLIVIISFREKQEKSSEPEIPESEWELRVADEVERELEEE
jgi:hypothetical protein